MANLFKNLQFFRQQLRFLPRFSQSFPAEKPASPLKHVEPALPTGTRTLEPPRIPMKSVNQHPKLQQPRNPPKALVIKPVKRSESKNKVAQTSNKAADDLTMDKEGHLSYTKMESSDPRISKIMSIVKTQKKSHNLVLLEGKRLLKEALEAHCKFECIMFSRIKDLDYLKPYLPKEGKLYKMPYREIQVWSELTTNPGIMGIFQVPQDNAFYSKEFLPLTIVCDNIREPSNLGAIIRTCSGVGCQEILLTKGCANVWDSKVLRSSCGAHFRANLTKNLDWEELRRKIPKNAEVFIADNNVMSSDSHLTDVDNLTVPVVPYFSIDFKSKKHIVLIIGGETEGINVESYKLAKEFNGVRLNVPLCNGVDSLNVGTALGIIGFEIKRQMAMGLRKDDPNFEAVHPHYL